MKEIKPIHRIVATELAKGRALRAICDDLDLNYHSWTAIVTAPLFKNEIQILSKSLAEKELDYAADDPVRKRIIEERERSVDRLAKERDNFDAELAGASSNTRIKASATLLELSGDFIKEKDEQKAPLVVINLNKEIAQQIMASQKPDVMPLNFTLKELATP